MAGRKSWPMMSKDEQLNIIQAGKEAWDDMDFELQNYVRDCQDRGRVTNNTNKAREAHIRYNTPGAPPLKPSADVFNCTGRLADDDVCGFYI